MSGSRAPRRRSVAADGLAAGALVLFAVFRTPGVAVLVGGLILVLVLPLAVRRLWPMPVFGVVLAAGSTAAAVGVAGDAVVIAMAIALYPVGLVAQLRTSVLAVGGALTTVVTAAVVIAFVPALPFVAPRPGEESFTTTPVTAVLYGVTVVGGSWLLARGVRARRVQAAQLADLRVEQAITQERLRIARDVHDVVGHSLGLITLKAAVATHLADTVPGEGPAALATIEQVSRRALDDVRSVIDGLRDDSAAGLDGIDALVAGVRAAGVRVEVERGYLAAVPAGVQASAYRIVQEALANVLRHAGPTRCRVVLADERGELAVSVIDEATDRDPPGDAGHGLSGIRERVARHGGTLRYGPRPSGGFGVHARLPHAAP